MWHGEKQFYEYKININQLLSGVSKDYILEVELNSQIIEESNCIQETRTEEEIQSSELIGSNLNIEIEQKTSNKSNSNQIFKILEAELKASNISINKN